MQPIKNLNHDFYLVTWNQGYKTFFMLNLAENENLFCL